MERFQQWREVLQVAHDVQTVRTVMRDGAVRITVLYSRPVASSAT